MIAHHEDMAGRDQHRTESHMARLAGHRSAVHEQAPFAGLHALARHRAGHLDAAGLAKTVWFLRATLPGVRLYQQCGYLGEQPVDYPLPNGLTITFVPMTKTLA